MTSHDLLIEKLSRSAGPVKRPWKPGMRVLTWVAIALPCGAATGLLLQRTLTDWSASGTIWVLCQLLLTFITGTLAIRNAFLLSIAGRRPLSGKWFALAGSLWFTATLVSLHLHHDTPLAVPPDGPNCYLFMMVVSVPMMAIMMVYLRRTRTLFPARSLAAAGAGVACMALTLLSLCHPTHISIADLVMHLAAVASIVGIMLVAGYKWVSLPVNNK